MFKSLMMGSLFVVGLGAAITWWAEVPARLDRLVSAEPTKPTPVQVKVPDAPPAAEPTPPEAAQNLDNSMSDLIPEAVTNTDFVDSGFGASYGSGGNGPAIGGTGGFGQGQGLVREALAGSRPPKIKMQTEVVYPPASKQKNIEGVVWVKFLVEASGKVSDVVIEKSEPPGHFESAVRSAVQSWLFEPGVKDGKVVASWLQKKIRFELDESL